VDIFPLFTLLVPIAESSAFVAKAPYLELQIQEEMLVMNRVAGGRDAVQRVRNR
jgi:hypothetical protein